MKHSRMLVSLAVPATLSILIFAHEAHAYVDPGTGSYVFQMLIAGLVGALATGLSPVIPASFGVTVLATMGAGAVKARRQRKELLDASPTRFLYYLDRTVKKR